MTKTFLDFDGWYGSDSVIAQIFRKSRRTLYLAILVSVGLALQGVAQSARPDKVVHAKPGARWHIKGDGMVCCPCKTPCPCRNNGRPSYGHCEATMYLKIRSGHYESVDMSGMNVVETGGMCATNYRHLSALYFDKGATLDQQAAYMGIIASISPDQTADFPYVRTVPMHVGSAGPSYYAVTIPGLLDLAADRNWGRTVPPMPKVAAPDTLSNEIQYSKNIRYQLHDDQAGMNFDYDGRQANYRSVDLDQDQYPAQTMLIQFSDGVGWFNAPQLHLIEVQKLALPDLEKIREDAIRLRSGVRQ